MNVVSLLAMSGTGDVHVARPVRISLACGSLVLVMIAGALRFGADIWDPRLFRFRR